MPYATVSNVAACDELSGAIRCGFVPTHAFWGLLKRRTTQKLPRSLRIQDKRAVPVT